MKKKTKTILVKEILELDISKEYKPQYLFKQEREELLNIKASLIKWLSIDLCIRK